MGHHGGHGAHGGKALCPSELGLKLIDLFAQVIGAWVLLSLRQNYTHEASA